MLVCVEDVIDTHKRFKAYFSDGTKVKFGQSNPKKGTFLDHRDKKLKTNYIKCHLQVYEQMIINVVDIYLYSYFGTNQH